MSEAKRYEIDRLIEQYQRFQNVPSTLCDAADYDALTQRLAELEEWKRIVEGTGTDQEAVIRMAATEYTKVAVECWKQRLAEVEQKNADLIRRNRILRLRPDLPLTDEQRVLFKQVENELAELQAEHARLREELKRRIDYQQQCYEDARTIQSLQQQLATAQGVWSTNLPTVEGGYWVETPFETVVMQVCRASGGFVVGTHNKPIEECVGWRFAGPLPLPQEAKRV